MKRLSDLLKPIQPLQVRGNPDVLVDKLADDSRAVAAGTLFAAVRGTRTDGHVFIEPAIAAGAISILCETLPGQLHPDVTYIQVHSTSAALAHMAEAYYDYPSHQIKIVAVTGTNGKTTVATQLYNLFELLGYRCGLLSTVENRIGGETLEAMHTTPAAIALSQLLHRMVAAQCTHCFMEASSHALDQNRMAGIRLTGGVFTNLTHDHLDYHKTFDAYLKAKKKLFDQLPAEAFALVNADDPRGRIMLQNTKAARYTYSIQGVADFRMRLKEQSLDGMLVDVEGRDVHLQMIGSFNASNMLAVFAVARLLGVEAEAAIRAMSLLKPVTGRLQVVRGGPDTITALVDYAHTPDALEQVLLTLRPLMHGCGRLLLVVGCGGNRDRQKRPLMGRVAARYASTVIITSDNPRDEDPQRIADEMLAGVPEEFTERVLSILNRREAIRTAVAMSQPGDVILVAGKGHERYQEIAGIRHPFDDRDELEQALKQKKVKT